MISHKKNNENTIKSIKILVNTLTHNTKSKYTYIQYIDNLYIYIKTFLL